MGSNTATPGGSSRISAYVEAWNSHDPDRVLACVTDDVVLDDKGLGERMAGPDQVRAMVVDMAEHFSTDYRVQLRDLALTTDEMFARSGRCRARTTRRTPRAVCPAPAGASGSMACPSDGCVTGRSPRSTGTGTWSTA
jgi:SnoaL-like protein